MFPTRIEFLGRTFRQDPAVVPHAPATELLCAQLRLLRYTSVLDLGCGSGVLGVSLWRAGVRLVMVDVDPAACALASENCAGIGTVLCGSWYEPVEGQFDLIVANPPHGTTQDWDDSVWAHGLVPRASVDGGPDGMDHIRAVIAGARPHMSGHLALFHQPLMRVRVAGYGAAAGLRVVRSTVAQGMAMTLFSC